MGQASVNCQQPHVYPEAPRLSRPAITHGRMKVEESKKPPGFVLVDRSGLGVRRKACRGLRRYIMYSHMQCISSLPADLDMTLTRRWHHQDLPIRYVGCKTDFLTASPLLGLRSISYASRMWMWTSRASTCALRGFIDVLIICACTCTRTTVAGPDYQRGTLPGSPSRVSRRATPSHCAASL